MLIIQSNSYLNPNKCDSSKFSSSCTLASESISTNLSIISYNIKIEGYIHRILVWHIKFELEVSAADVLS